MAEPSKNPFKAFCNWLFATRQSLPSAFGKIELDAPVWFKRGATMVLDWPVDRQDMTTRRHIVRRMAEDIAAITTSGLALNARYICLKGWKQDQVERYGREAQLAAAALTPPSRGQS